MHRLILITSVALAMTCGSSLNAQTSESLVGQRILTRYRSVPLYQGNMIVGNSSQLVFPLTVRSVQGDWLEVWDNYIRSITWIHRSHVCTINEAIPYFSSRISSTPYDDHLYFMRSEAYRELGQDAEALQDVNMLVQLRPTARSRNIRANQLRQMGRYDEALAEYNWALAIQPGYYLALLGRGRIWVKLEKWDLALSDFNQAIAFNPNYVNTYFDRARVWKVKHEYARAISDFEQALRLDPNSTRALDSLAWMKATCPEPSFRNGIDAVRLANSACEKTQWGNSYFIESLAAAYGESGKIDDALAKLQKATEVGPTLSIERRRLMRLSFEAGHAYQEDTAQEPMPSPESPRPYAPPAT